MGHPLFEMTKESLFRGRRQQHELVIDTHRYIVFNASSLHLSLAAGDLRMSSVHY